MRTMSAIALCSALTLIGSAAAQDSQPATSQPTSQPATSQPTSAPASAPASQPLPGASAAFSAPIDAAHGGNAWRNHEAVQMDIRIEMGGEVAIDGQLTFRTDMSRVRMDLADGTAVIWDGEQAHVSPADSEFGAARFHVLTWPYFVSAPFKLDDPGSTLTIEGTQPVHGVAHPAARLTFDEGVGDAPDDWYLICREPETDLVCAMAYIVTYFRGGATGEEEVHAIAYREPVEVEGVTLSTQWDFCEWNEAEGIHGEPLGHAEISNIAFISPAPDAFVAPEDSRIDSLPHG